MLTKNLDEDEKSKKVKMDVLMKFASFSPPHRPRAWLQLVGVIRFALLSNDLHMSIEKNRIISLMDVSGDGRREATLKRRTYREFNADFLVY